MAFTNTIVDGVTVITMTGTEDLGATQNFDLSYSTIGTSAVMDVIYSTTATWDTVAGGEEKTLFGGFTAGVLNSVDISKTSMSLSNSGGDGIFSGIAGEILVFTNATTAAGAVDDYVTLINNESTFPFIASRVDGTDTVTLRLTGKVTVSSFGTIVETSNTQTGYSSFTSTAGTPDIEREGLTVTEEGGRIIYDLADTTRFLIDSGATLNHNTEHSLIKVRRAAVNPQPAIVGVREASTANPTPGVYNFGVQKVESTYVLASLTAQDVAEDQKVLVPQVGKDNSVYVAKTAQTGVTTSTTFSTANYTQLPDSPKVFTDGVGIIFLGRQGNSTGNDPRWYGAGQGGAFGGTSSHDLGLYASATTDHGGILNINGGRMEGRFQSGFGRNAKINNISNAKWLVDNVGAPAGRELLSRFTGGILDTNEFTYEGGQISIVQVFNDYTDAEGNTAAGGAPGNGLTYTASRSNAGVAYWNQTNQDMTTNPGLSNIVTLKNVNFVNNVVDVAPYATSSAGIVCTRVQNCAQGSGLNLNGGETAGTQLNDNTNQYVFGTRQIETNFRSLSDDSLQTGVIYCQDTNRNSNLGDPIDTAGYLDNSQYTYFGEFDGSSNLTSWDMVGSDLASDIAGTLLTNIADKEVLLYTYGSKRTGSAVVRGTQDIGIWRKNIRGNNDTPGEDQFTFQVWSYENQPLTLTAVLSGDQVYIFGDKLVLDSSHTNDREVIDPLNSSLGNKFVVSNSGITTTTTVVNLDQVYDLCKYKKETSVANVVIPTVSTLILESDGTELDLGTITTTVGTAKWTVGTKHKAIKHGTEFDASKITQSSDLTITAPIITSLPTTVSGTIVNSTASTGTGGHAFDISSNITGDWTLTNGDNNFNGTWTGDRSVTNGSVAGPVTDTGVTLFNSFPFDTNNLGFSSQADATTFMSAIGLNSGDTSPAGFTIRANLGGTPQDFSERVFTQNGRLVSVSGTINQSLNTLSNLHFQRTLPTTNTLNDTHVGDTTLPDGDASFGINFDQDGTLTMGTGTATFNDNSDVSKLILVAPTGKTISVLGKSQTEFISTDTGNGTVLFPTAATRLTIELSSLPVGSTYVLYNDSVEVTPVSPLTNTISTNQADLEFSNIASDGTRTHISSGIAGNWYLYYVDTDKRATFKGIAVTETTSSTVIEEFTLTPTEFLNAFEVPSANVMNPLRTLTVGDTDFQVIADSGVQLNLAFPTNGTAFSFGSDADALTFLSAMGISSTEELVELPTTGGLFIRVGTKILDFTGAAFVRQGGLVAVRIVDVVGLNYSFDAGLNIFIAESRLLAVFDLSGCPVSNWADEAQSSLLVANARNSVNYLNAMARQLDRETNPARSIPTNGSVETFDSVRPVLAGADWRDGRYLIEDDELGTQKVSGWYEVEDIGSFTQGTRTNRQLTNLYSSIDSTVSGRDTQVQSQVRLISSAPAIAAATRAEVKELTDPIDSVVNSIETKVDTVDTVVDSIQVDTDSIETKVDIVDTVVDSIQVDTDSIETKVDAVDAVVDQIDGVNNFTAQQINDLGIVSDFDKNNLPSIDDV